MRAVAVADETPPKLCNAKPGATVHPLGSIVYRVAARQPAGARVVATLVLVVCVALVSVGVWLKPNPSGLGTHEQFGLPPCTMVILVGYPCPTCGMTTAFAHAVRGELLSAFNAQPAGLAFALATIVAGGVSLSVLLTGKVLAVNWYRVRQTHVALAAVLIVLGGWGYKVAVGAWTGSLPMERWESVIGDDDDAMEATPLDPAGGVPADGGVQAPDSTGLRG